MTRDSSLTGLRGDHVRLIGRYWTKFSMRTGGGLLTILVVLIAGLSVGAAFATPVEQLMNEAPGLGHREGEGARAVDRIARSDGVKNVVQWVTGEKEAQVSYLLRDQPALLSAILLVLLIAFPFITCLGAFNQTSGDIGNRGLRYLLLRTERPNVFLGRYLGTLAFLAVPLALVMLILSTYIGVKFNIYPLSDLVLWTLQGYVGLVFLMLPHAALCAWVSTMIDAPFGALTICLLLVGFPIVFLLMANAAMRGDLEGIERVLPWGWKYDLLSADLGRRLLAYGVMLAFTALFLWLGLRHFRNRDL